MINLSFDCVLLVSGLRPNLAAGGERGIRTPGGFKPTHAFQACALNHSAISPTNDRTVKKLFKVCNIFRSATPPECARPGRSSPNKQTGPRTGRRWLRLR